MTRHIACRLAVVAALSTIAVAGTVTASGGEIPAGLQDPVHDRTPVFTAGVELVSVAVAVRDRRGRVVQGLAKDDFQVIDSGMPAKIEGFHTSDSPISLAVLLDISGSMSVGGNMDRARDAASVAMRTLHAGSDEAALFTFDSELERVVPFTTDLDRVRRVSLEGRPWGQTSLFDAVAQTARVVGDRANKRRALLVISDGVDTGSRLSAPEVSAIASAIDVPVYLLVVVNPSDHPGGEYSVLPSDGPSTGAATLADLARWTGGDLRFASEPAHTVAGIQDLFIELRHQYILTFEPGMREGWHPLDIRTRRKNLIVHARSGYTAGPIPDAHHAR